MLIPALDYYRFKSGSVQSKNGQTDQVKTRQLHDQADDIARQLMGSGPKPERAKKSPEELEKIAMRALERQRMIKLTEDSIKCRSLVIRERFELLCLLE